MTGSLSGDRWVVAGVPLEKLNVQYRLAWLPFIAQTSVAEIGRERRFVPNAVCDCSPYEAVVRLASVNDN